MRKLIRNGGFVESQRQAIIAALEPFDKDRKIRFQPTNVEDSRYFTGAGLYSSYSGCLLDDIDDDEVALVAAMKASQRSVVYSVP